MWLEGLICFWGALLGGVIGGAGCMLHCIRDIESQNEETCYHLRKIKKRLRRMVPKKEG